LVPTGTITFRDGTATLGTGTLDASGNSTYATSSLAVGSHSITAEYGGDSDNSGSTSTGLSMTINAPLAADFSITVSPTSGSITAGNPATVTVTINPLNGFNLATSFACSGLPAHSVCNFSPSSVTPNGTAVVTTTLTINSDEAAAAIAGGGAILSFLLLPVVVRQGRTRKLLASATPILLLGLLALALSACSAGSGGGITSKNNNTPKGTYPITVTATSGSISHSATYSYTVK